MKSFLSMKAKEEGIQGKKFNRLHKREKFLYSQEINNQKYRTIQEKLFSMYRVNKSPKLIRII